MPERSEKSFIARQYLWHLFRHLFPSEGVFGRHFFEIASISLVFWQFATGMLLSPYFLDLKHIPGSLLVFVQATHRWGAILLLFFALCHLVIRFYGRSKEDDSPAEWLAMMLLGTVLFVGFLTGSLLIPGSDSNWKTLLALFDKLPYIGALAVDFLQIKTSQTFAKTLCYVAHASMVPIAILFLFAFRCFLSLYFLQIQGDFMKEEPKVAAKVPAVVELEPGTYYWCRCGLSKKQPFCDGSHLGTTFVPMEFEVTTKKKVALCQCKRTKNSPYCDGTHRTI